MLGKLSKLKKGESKEGKKGFTLIELLVAVAIIGILSAVVISSLGGARAKARDTRRKSDLNQIRIAMVMYFNEKGDWVGSTSGCGYDGQGAGWFNYAGGPYPKSIMQCLIDAEAAKQEIIDPTGGRANSTPTNSFYNYMKYSCGVPSKAYVYAKLETIPQSTTATDGTCCPTCDSSYGMNYYVLIE